MSPSKGPIYKCALAPNAQIVRLDLSLQPMIDLRPATADEMVLAFLQGDIETLDPDRRQLFAAALRIRGADKDTLIHRGDLHDPQQNADRRFVLGVRGYGAKQALFTDFPDDAVWRLVKVKPEEVKGFKYVNRLEHWARASGGTRLVANGVKNLDHVQNGQIKSNVAGIADRLNQGEKFPPLIAVQCTGAAEMVLIEGHHRATAHALTNLPDQIAVIIGTSPHMAGWVFF